MGHEYNEMIDILSESINLTESMPMAREGMIEEFGPIFAEDYYSSLDPYYNDELVNPVLLNLDSNRRPFAREDQPGRLYYRRNFRRSNSQPQRNIVFCSYARPRPNNFMPMRSVPSPINLSNNLTQTQTNTNNIQIELSSDSGDETEIVPRRHSRGNREQKRQEFRNKKQGNSSARQINQIQPALTAQGPSDQIQVLGRDENRRNSSQIPSNSQQHQPSSSVDHGTDEIPCDCSQCLPESENQSQNKRKHHEQNRTCKKVKRQLKPIPSSSHMNVGEPLPGPSGITSNLSNLTHQMVDSSDSDDEVIVRSTNHSDVLTAPELQLDCFSDTSSGSDVIAIDTPNASSISTVNNSYERNGNISNEEVQSRPTFHRNRGFENTGGSSNSQLRPLMSINTPGTPSDIYRCPYNQNFSYSQHQRNNYCVNNNRHYPDARAPNAPDFGRNSVFNSNGSNFSNSSNSSQSNTGGQNRSVGRWVNRGDHHYRRRFHNNAPRPPAYPPHQRLWHQQNFSQEVYRRFMSSYFEEGDRHYDNHGLSMNYNPQAFSPHHWHRRGYPVHPTPHGGSFHPMRLFHGGFQEDDFSTMFVPTIRRYPNRGASQETIENNTLSYKFQPINENFDSEKCSICLSPFEVDTFVRRLPCMHFYHRDCIEQWLQLNSTCPICRIDIQKARNI